jgi:hypothetical protein
MNRKAAAGTASRNCRLPDRAPTGLGNATTGHARPGTQWRRAIVESADTDVADSERQNVRAYEIAPDGSLAAAGSQR